MGKKAGLKREETELDEHREEGRWRNRERQKTKVGEQPAEARIAKTACVLRMLQPCIHGGPRTPQEATPYACKASLDFSLFWLNMLPSSPQSPKKWSAKEL